MASVLDPLLLGVIAALNADPVVTMLVEGRIFDTKAPDATPFPYITVTSPTESPFDAFNRRGNDTSLTLHIWYREAGNSPREISARVVHSVYREVESVLNYGPIAIAGATFMSGRLVYVAGMLDPDGFTYHGVARYDVLTRS